MDATETTASQDWFDQEVGDLQTALNEPRIDVTALLSATRQEFYDSLATFYSQVRHLMSLFIAVFVALGFVLKEVQGQTPIVVGFSGGLLLMTAAVSFFAYRIISAQYGMYVSAVIYSAQMHIAMGLDSHLWFDEVKFFADGAKTKREVIDRWMRQRDSTAKNYFSIIICLTIVACLSGMGLLVWSFWR